MESKQLKGFRFAASKTFYPYNAGTNDAGWGCAWRCIQMLLSELRPDFPELFNVFGDKQTLLNLYSALHPSNIPGKKALALKKFAPHDLTNGWAEPLIAELVLHHY